MNLPGTPTAIQGQKEGLCNTTGNVFSIPAVASATSYVWTATGGTITGGQGTTSITVDVATLVGGGSITVQAVNGCGAGLVRSLTITGAPARPGVITGSTSFCVNTNQTFSVATVPSTNLYQWNYSGQFIGVTGAGTKTITIQPIATGSYSISVEAVNVCGNSPTRTLSPIMVNNCPRVGSSANATFNMNLFPNPASDHVTIHFTSEDISDYRLRISDIAGRILFLENGTASAGLNAKVLSLDGFATGVYNLTIEMNKIQQQIKLIVE